MLGAKQEVVDRVAEILTAKHPNLHLAGLRSGYWSEDEEPEVGSAIKAACPDVLFVAMSSPKKEIFLRKWKYEFRVPFVMGVGRTFDVVAGLFKRAPVWMQRCGLEWFTVWDKSRAGSGAAIWQRM